MVFIESFKDSAREMRCLKSMCIASMLTAVCICLGFFQIQIGEIIRFSFGFIAISIIGFLYGPVVAGICSGISDIITFVIRPTGAFFPGFTLSAILVGITCGIFLYKHKVSLIRVLLAMMFIGVFLNIVLNSLWLTILYGYGFLGILPARILKNIVSITLNTAVCYMILKSLEGVLDKIKTSK